MRALRRFRLTAPEPSEDEFQKSVADLLEAVLVPDKAMFSHFPAGGYLLTPAARARLYRLGLRAGWPDLVICYWPGKSLWLELKTSRGYATVPQKRRHKQLWVLGHPVEICRSIEDVLAVLAKYDVPIRRARLAESYHGKIDQGAAQGAAAQPAPGTGA